MQKSIIVLLIVLGVLSAIGLSEAELLHGWGSFKKQDADFDGLTDAFEIKIGTDPRNADTDRDGIDDGLEVMLMGRFFGGDPKHYPSPVKADIYVDVQWMAAGEDAHAIPAEAKEEIVRVFARAPTRNPDGSTGIRLHMDDGGPIFHEDPITGEPYILSTYGLINGWDHLYRQWYEGSSKAGIYHYAVIAHDIEGNAFLASLNPGDTFVVAGSKVSNNEEWVIAFVLGLARNIGIPVDELTALDFSDPGFWAAVEEKGVGVSFASVDQTSENMLSGLG